MANFFSYVPLLAKTLRMYNPKNILEWGTGESTKIMRQLCPEANITSIEKDPVYYEEYRKLSDSKLWVLLIPEDTAYINYPFLLQQKFDLIFVDGKDDLRAKCLHVAYDVLADDGVVLLHDAERSWYREAIALFKTIEVNDGTVALKK